jgi:hypothetical protein
MDIDVNGICITVAQTNITSLGLLNILNVSGQTTLANMYASGICTFQSAVINSIDINPVDLGINAGALNQATSSIAIGNSAGYFNQGTNSIAIGSDAGSYTQGENTIAIGNRAGQTNQGSGSIAIGFLAGSQQASNSIVLSSLGTVVTGTTSNSTYIAPLRNITQNISLGYNTITNELSYFNPYISERIQIPIASDIASNVCFNTNYLLKWNGTAVGSISGLTNDTTTGILSFANTGLYLVFVYVRYYSVNNGQKDIWIYNSVDVGTGLTTSNVFTSTSYAFSSYILNNVNFSLYTPILVASGSTPMTLAVRFSQATENSANIGIQTATNLQIVRIA